MRAKDLGSAQDITGQEFVLHAHRPARFHLPVSAHMGGGLLWEQSSQSFPQDVLACPVPMCFPNAGVHHWAFYLLLINIAGMFRNFGEAARS